jgi:hypothetical protein
MKYIDNIAWIMSEAGVESIDFLYNKVRPVIQKDGIKYEVLIITAPDKGDTSLHICVKPSYAWATKDLQMDESWRKTTWVKMTRVIESEINRFNN